MRAVIIGVGALVIVGVIATIWFMTSGNSRPVADASPLASSSQGPLPGATPTTGSEVQTPAPGQTQTDPGRLPPITAPTPLATAPLPASASATGSLVTGFPVAIMGPSDGSDVLDSSIAAEGTTMQVTLLARTDQSPDSVTAHFKNLWEGLGLSVGTSADGLTAAGSFESFTLAFSSSGTGTGYSVLGVMRTG